MAGSDFRTFGPDVSSSPAYVCRLATLIIGGWIVDRSERILMKAVFPLFLLCSLVHGAACPSAQAKDEATLVQIEHTWLQAMDQHDTAALECILAAEFEEADFMAH